MDKVGNSFWLFKDKLQNVKKALSKWSRDIYSDIFQQLAIRKYIMSIKENIFEEQPTEQNKVVLQQAHAEM